MIFPFCCPSRARSSNKIHYKLAEHMHYVQLHASIVVEYFLKRNHSNRKVRGKLEYQSVIPPAFPPHRICCRQLWQGCI